MHPPRTRFAVAIPILWNAVGLGLVALSGYVFVAVVDRRGHSQGTAGLVSFYFLVTTIVLGITAGVEQATNRRIAFTLAAGTDLRRAVATSIRGAGALVLGAAVLLCMAIPILVPRTLRGSVALFAMVLVGLILSAASSVVRGVLVGARRFRPYALTWAIEGLTRIGLLLGVLLVGQPAGWVLGAYYVLPFAIAGVLGLRWLTDLRAAPAPPEPGLKPDRPPSERPPSERPGGGSGLVSLAGAGLLTLAVANLPQLILGTRDVSADDELITFGQVFLLARIALTALAPVQSVLLPSFTAAAATHDLARLRRHLRWFTLACIVGAVLWTTIVTAVGPPLAAVLFAGPPTSRTLFFLLGLGTVAMAAGAPLQIALVAMGAYRWVPLGWATGVVVTAALAFWPGFSPVTGATFAAMFGPTTAVLTMLVGIRATFRSSDQPVANSTVEPVRSR